MKRLVIQEHDELPSWQQFQALMQETQNRVAVQGDPISPLSFLITLLIISNQINTAHSKEYSNAYWAYFPDPPLLQPVGWEGRSIPIYTNDTVALGGFSDTIIWDEGMLVFSHRMPKLRAGCPKGWYTGQRRSLVNQMRRLTVQEHDELPSRQQLQALM